MIIALLSAKPIEEEKMRHIISKKLDLINNVQIALDKNDNLILYSGFLAIITILDLLKYPLSLSYPKTSLK